MHGPAEGLACSSSFTPSHAKLADSAAPGDEFLPMSAVKSETSSPPSPSSVYFGQAAVMFPGAAVHGLSKVGNSKPNALDAVAAFDIGLSAIFMELPPCGRSVEAQLLAANGTPYRLNRQLARRTASIRGEPV